MEGGRGSKKIQIWIKCIFCIWLLNYGSGPCSWWSAASPIATSAEFPGCGVVPISDPFGRSGICGRSSVSPAHLNVQQPPRRSKFI